MLITDVLVCDSSKEARTNIRVSNGIIEEIGDNLQPNDKEKIICLKSKNIAIMPYFYDLNVRVKNNSLSMKNVKQVIKQAKKSGIFRISITPDCIPPINNELSLEAVNSYDNVMPICHSEDSNRLSQISILLKQGSLGIYLESLDGNTIRCVCEYALINKTPIFFKSYDNNLSTGFMHNGLVASQMGIKGIDDIAQISQVARMTQIGEFFKSTIIFNSITSSKSIDIINESKKENNFFIQTPIHHFILSDNECRDFNTLAKIFPPLKDEKEREKLIQSLIDDKIDILTSMQACENKTNKDLPFEDAGYGIDDIEIYFSLCYTYLVKSGFITLSHLSKLLSANNQKIFNVKPTIIEKNTPIENLIFIDLDHEFRVENSNSVYNNHNLYSKIIQLEEIISI